MIWIRIFLFYAIALCFSYVFRINTPEWFDSLELGNGLTIFKYLAEGIGPFLGAIIVLVFFKPKRNITFLGTSKVKSLLMVVLPLVLFTFIGVGNTKGINEHYYGFLLGLMSLLYAILEEVGWRGYLLEELKRIFTSPIVRAIVMGLLWYIWHLNFNINAENFTQHLLFLGMLIFASWGFEKIIDDTKSILSVACFHFLGSIMSYNTLLQGGLADNQRWLIFGICLATWIYIVSNWSKKVS